MEPERIPISLVAHHAFCPRRAWLEVNGEATDTAQVAEGVIAHDAVDEPATSRKKRLRAVDVYSDRLGVVGRCDSIEFADDDSITVVEHKANPVRKRTQPTFAQRVQLALQAICLRERGHVVTDAAVWFTTSRKRVAVDLDDELLSEAEEQVRLARLATHSKQPPPVLEDDTQCSRCSHVSVCLPDEHRQRSVARPISVSDPSGRILHLASPGSRASLNRGRIAVRGPGIDETFVPLGQVIGVVVHGNADVSSGVVRELLLRGCPIVWCTWSGRVAGWASPAATPNGDAHADQYSLDDVQRLTVARAIVRGKILNQAALLRRHTRDERSGLKDLSLRVRDADSLPQVLGFEGRAAALYFSAFGAMVAPHWAAFSRRTGRPATDHVNAALNVCYSLLLADAIRAVVACGLDLSGGVMHSAGRNKPALALDLMEEFRAPLADSAVLWAFNNGELRPGDFRFDPDAVRISPRGRKALIAAYERRATSEFRHPQFGYSVSWRRAMEVQARLFLAFVRRELNAYIPVITR